MRSLFITALALALLPAWAAEPVGKRYEPGAFDSLQLAGSAQVRFRQGERDEVLVEGDEAAQRSVELRLSGTRLTVNTVGGWSAFTRPRPQLLVMARQLRELGISGASDFVAPDPVQMAELRVQISGSGLARFDQIKVGELRFGVSGAGDGHFAGQAERLRVSISGRGDLQAEQLAARQVELSISGLGKARLWALQQLDVNTSGISTVDYWGSPQLNRRSSGIATLNALGAKEAPR